MKTLCLFLVAAIVSFSLLSCSSPTNQVDTQISGNEYSVSADWIMYDTLSDINESADCIVVAKVLSRNSSISVGYDSSAFDNFPDLIESDPVSASKMKLSIRTPFTIEIEEVISSDVEISTGDIVDLYQLGGTYSGVTLTEGATTPVEVGSEYVLILKQQVMSDSTTYFSMITPIQGYAEIVENNTSLMNIFSSEHSTTYRTHENNHLFDEISSIEDIYDALEDD